MVFVYELRHYVTPNGKDVYMEWRNRLRNHQAAIAIDRRLNRLAFGNFGDHKHLVEGVWELRMDVGAGYRVYYAIDGVKVVLLLCAGDKSTQKSDIKRAREYWQDWKNRGLETAQ